MQTIVYPLTTAAETMVPVLLHHTLIHMNIQCNYIIWKVCLFHYRYQSMDGKYYKKLPIWSHSSHFYQLVSE